MLCPSVHLSVDTWVVATSWLLGHPHTSLHVAMHFTFLGCIPTRLPAHVDAPPVGLRAAAPSTVTSAASARGSDFSHPRQLLLLSAF